MSNFKNIAVAVGGKFVTGKTKFSGTLSKEHVQLLKAAGIKTVFWRI